MITEAASSRRSRRVAGGCARGGLVLLVLVALTAFVGVGPVLADGASMKSDDQAAAQGTTRATPEGQAGPATSAQTNLPSDEQVAEESEEQEIFPSESSYDPEEAGNPLRIVAYVLHPVGVILDTLIFRPAYWLGSHEPIKTLVGQTD